MFPLFKHRHRSKSDVTYVVPLNNNCRKHIMVYQALFWHIQITFLQLRAYKPTNSLGT